MTVSEQNVTNSCFFPRTREWQLFDLIEDPQELTSRHADPAYQAILEGLKKRYFDLRDFYEVNWAVTPATRGDEKWWRDRDLAKKKLIRQGNAELLFIGDSITQSWEGPGKSVWEDFYGDRNAINLGFSGDRTEHVIWRLTHSNIEMVKPRLAVVMIGTNNTGHSLQKPREVAEGIKRILEIMAERLPQTKVLLLGVFPRGKEPHDIRRLNNRAINQFIRRFHDGERVHYLDIGNFFLEADGTIHPSVMPDMLHLSSDGYQRWANAIEPKLQELWEE